MKARVSQKIVHSSKQPLYAMSSSSELQSAKMASIWPVYCLSDRKAEKAPNSKTHSVVKLKTHRLFSLRAGICACSIAALLTLPGDLQAGNAWTGLGGNGNWSTPGNWSGNAVPNYSSFISFSGTSQTTTNNDIAVDTGVAGISFFNVTPNQAFTLGGNRIKLDGNITTSALTSGSNATILDTINFDMILTGSRDFTVRNSSFGNHNLTVAGVISESSAGMGLNKTGGFGSVLTLGNSSNSFTGTVQITSGAISVATIGNAGSNSALGAGSTIVSGISGGGTAVLSYTGTGNTTDRRIQLGNSSSTSTLGMIIENVGASGGASTPLVFSNPNFNVVFSGSTGAKMLTLQGTNTNNNQISGIIADNSASGTIGITKGNSGTWVLAGANTFTGQVQLDNGTLSFSTIGDSGVASNLGAGGTIITANGGGGTGTLSYTGTGSSTNRQIQIGNTSSSSTVGLIIENVGTTGALVFSNNNFNVAVPTNTGIKTLTLQGTNTNNNQITGIIADNSATGTIGITKGNSGTWVLAGANTFSGQVQISNGTLSVNTVANTGVASALGTGAATNSSVIAIGAGTSSGVLIYTGSANGSTDRQIQIGSSPISTGTATIQNDGPGTLTFSNANFNANDSSITNVSAARTLTLRGTNNGTISGIISNNVGSVGGTVGVISLTKGNAGTWTLGGVNTFTGQVQLDNGTLSFGTIGDSGVASNLGAGGTIITANSAGATGTLSYTGSGSTTNRQIQIGTGLTFSSTVGLVIENVGATGALVISNANFNVAASSFTAAKTLTLQGTNTNNNQITGVIADNSANGTIGITKGNSGRWVLAGANTFSGQVQILNGTLSVNSVANTGVASALGTGAATNSSVIAIGAGTSSGVLIYTGSANGSTDRQIQIGSSPISAGTATIQNDGPGTLTFSNANFNANDSSISNVSAARTLTLRGTNNGTISGIISNNVGSAVGVISLSKGDIGTWVLAGANTFSGQAQIDSGTLSVNSIANASVASALGTGATNSVIRIGASTSTGTLLYTGSANATTDRQIQIGFDISRTGGATIQNDSATGTLTFSNPTFNTSDTSITNVSAARTLTLRGTNNGTISGIISNNVGSAVGVISLTKGNAGMWILGGVNTFSGQVQIDNGTLSVNTVANTGVASALGTGAVNSTIRMGASTSTGTLIYTGSTNATTDRQIQIGSSTINNGGATIQNDSATGTLTFSNANFNNSDTSITNVSAARTLTLRGSNTGNNTVSGIISDNVGSAVGAVSLTKGNSGTWVLEGANTYSGGTNVSNGTLLLNNTTGSGTGTGAVTTSSGTTLGGTGAISPAGSSGVIIAGSVAPGVSGTAGTLNFTPVNGNVTFQNTSGIAFELFGNGSNDKIVFNASGSGVMNFSAMTAGSLIVSFVGGYAPALNDSFDLLDWSALSGTAITGLNASQLSLSTAGFDPAWSWDTTQFTTNGVITIVNNVPEPSRLLLLLLSGSAALCQRRRHRHNREA